MPPTADDSPASGSVAAPPRGRKGWLALPFALGLAAIAGSTTVTACRGAWNPTMALTAVVTAGLAAVLGARGWQLAAERQAALLAATETAAALGRRAEEAARESLREKEALAGELRRRVASSLAVVSNLFKLQSLDTRDPAVLAVLDDAQARTRSMTMVHERLYGAADLSRIDFAAFLDGLLPHLCGAFGPSARVSVDAAPLRIGIDQAVPCGLIVDELVRSAFTHAYPPGRPGEVRVAIRVEDGRAVVRVADDGAGIPARTEPSAARALGLRFVRSMAEQLDGSIAFRPLDPGTEVVLTFPLAGDDGASVAG